jgi:uncharacterized delta-60 repeat protein
MKKFLVFIVAAASLALPLWAQAAAGELDPSFGSDGKVVTGGLGFALAVAIEPNGKIVAAGQTGGDFSLARYNRDGSLDPSFGSGGKVLTDFGGGSSASAHGVALQPDGKIVAAGHSRGFALARYLAR